MKKAIKAMMPAIIGVVIITIATVIFILLSGCASPQGYQPPGKDLWRTVQ